MNALSAAILLTCFASPRVVLAQGFTISTVAGNGQYVFSGDGGQATTAQLFYPAGLAIDAAGNLYIADAGNDRIRKVSTNGIITTVAGNGIRGFSGDGGPATDAALQIEYLNPTSGLAVDLAGNLYIADSWNNRVRKVSNSGIITTIAGGGGSSYGDGGLATNAKVIDPAGLAFDSGETFTSRRFTHSAVLFAR